MAQKCRRHGPRMPQCHRIRAIRPSPWARCAGVVLGRTCSRFGKVWLASARVLVVGCGAIGGVLAQTFTRVGVGELVLVDRDVVELTNLPRQVLFEDRHAADGTPKALAAAETLARIGGPTKVVAHPLHLDAGNVEELAAGCDLILDGTDNLATRYLLNDHCVANEVPWVYAGVVASEGPAGFGLPANRSSTKRGFPTNRTTTTLARPSFLTRQRLPASSMPTRFTRTWPPSAGRGCGTIPIPGGSIPMIRQASRSSNGI